jgi:hypothetical protein
MSRLLPTALAVLSLASFAGLAHAQGPRGNQDANGDGVISAQEFDDAAKARFQRMDANHDGVIDADELAAIQKRMEERRADRPDAGKGPGGGGGAWAAMDADHDGKVTQAEALVASKARFAKLDADKRRGAQPRRTACPARTAELDRLARRAVDRRLIVLAFDVHRLDRQVADERVGSPLGPEGRHRAVARARTGRRRPAARACR